MSLQTSTGDTLVSSQKSAVYAAKSYQNSSTDENRDQVLLPVLAGMDIPDPVFFCSIEPPSLSYQKALDHALDCLLREDPSLSVTFDSDTGQTILGGMGELHLEVIKDRIHKVCNSFWITVTAVVFIGKWCWYQHQLTVSSFGKPRFLGFTIEWLLWV